jgi:hypothetical protein
MKTFFTALIVVATIITGSSAAAVSKAASEKICLAICYPEYRDCPPGMIASGSDDCWTCCTEAED